MKSGKYHVKTERLSLTTKTGRVGLSTKTGKVGVSTRTDRVGVPTKSGRVAVKTTTIKKWKNAAEVCTTFDLSKEGRELLDPETGARPFIKKLIHAELYVDAVNFLARWLPKREAVWWLCLATRLKPPVETAAANAVLKSVERWVVDPNEANRRAAFPEPIQTLTSPDRCAAAGAFFSGGSLAPEGIEPPVVPAEGLTATAVAGGMQILVALGPAEKSDETYRAVIDLGNEIASGYHSWAGRA